METLAQYFLGKKWAVGQEGVWQKVSGAHSGEADPWQELGAEKSEDIVQ